MPEETTGPLKDEFESEKAKLDDKLITSRIKTYEYTDYDIVENNGIIEYRPRYPNWTAIDIAVGNLQDDKDKFEETAIRKAMESALSLQAWGMKNFQIKEIDKIAFVKIPQPEPIKRVLLYVGQTSDQPILIQTENEKGEEILQQVIIPGQAIFRIVEADENQILPLYEEKRIKEKAKFFLNLAPECHRLHWYCMTRLGLTKSRNMEAARLLHKQYTHHETKLNQEENEKDGLFGIFQNQKNK